MRFCVVGGGILGLATARALVRAHPGDEVVVLEKEHAVATHQTGRNSGVVHAGVYYAPGSLKARLCRRGVELLKPYCLEHGLPYEEVGKVVVAVDRSELPGLEELHRRAVANGVPGARMLDAAGLRELEPHAAGIAALHSPTTAITDYGAVARQLAADVIAGGGEVRPGTQVVRVLRQPRAGGAAAESGLGAGGPEPGVSGVRDGDAVAGAEVVLGDGSRLRADRVIVCAGLQSDQVARASGVFDGPRIVPFRGEYFALRPDRTDLVRGLIYPVPDPALPFLGIHLTRRVGGGVLVGPNAVLALGRESYRWRDLDRHDIAELIRWPGARRLIWTQRRTAITELRRSASRRRFMAEAQRYVPALQPGDVARAVAGVRAQAVDDDGHLIDDFLIDDDGTVAWVRNAPSPAATSSLAIAEELLMRTGLAG